MDFLRGGYFCLNLLIRWMLDTVFRVDEPNDTRLWPKLPNWGTEGLVWLEGPDQPQFGPIHLLCPSSSPIALCHGFYGVVWYSCTIPHHSYRRVSIAVVQYAGVEWYSMAFSSQHLTTDTVTRQLLSIPILIRWTSLKQNSPLRIVAVSSRIQLSATFDFCQCSAKISFVSTKSVYLYLCVR